MAHKWTLSIMVEVKDPAKVKEMAGMPVTLPAEIKDEDIRCRLCGHSYPHRAEACE